MKDEPEDGSEVDGVAGLDPYDAVDFDDLEVIGSVGAWSAADARQSGDDAVGGLDKITAQMSAASTGPSSRRCAGPWPRRWPRSATWSSRRGPAPASRWPTWSRPSLSGKKVVVATATKALQDQLAGKDLPLLEAGLGLPAPARLRRAERSEQLPLPPAGARGRLGGVQPELGDQRPVGEDAESGGAGRWGWCDRAEDGAPPEGLVEEVRRLVTWAARPRHRRPGRTALRAVRRAWNMVSVGPASARAPSTARRGGQCFAEAARDRAAAADIVVVNTHLYGAHLASGRVVLPEHDVVVFDEAHELEDVMTASLGVEVTPAASAGPGAPGALLVEDGPRAVRDAADLGDQLGGRWSSGSARGCSTTGAGYRPRTARSRRAGAGRRRLAALTDALRRSGNQGSRRRRRGRPGPGQPHGAYPCWRRPI